MPSVYIVGGGLAGLTSAFELAERGFDVTVYEGGHDLGGKAASITDNDVFDGNLGEVSTGIACDVRSDHGYHVFPRWYVNMRRLWSRIGLPASDVFESGEYYGLQRGSDYEFLAPIKKSRRELLSLLDLVTRTDDEVDSLSFRGFVYSRIYNDLDSVSLNQLFLNALSIPEYDISSRVVRNLFRQWMPVIEEKNWAALKGSLGEILIDRLVEATQKAADKSGGSLQIKKGFWLKKIKLGTNGDPILQFFDEDKEPANGKNRSKPKEELSDGPIVMALPLEALRVLVTDELFHAEPALRFLHYLNAHPFGAMDVYFNEKLPNIPQDHFDLVGSVYNLSAIDISNHWPDFSANGFDGSVLQFVAGSCKSLVGLSSPGFARAMLDEIVQFIPHATATGIAYIVPHTNATQPLFVNDVKSWDYRPETVGRLFTYAGDYVRNETDITSMEGAVRSGLNAAEAIRQRSAPEKDTVRILPPTGFTTEELHIIRSEQVIPGRVKAFFGYRLKEILGDL